MLLSFNKGLFLKVLYIYTCFVLFFFSLLNKKRIFGVNLTLCNVMLNVISYTLLGLNGAIVVSIIYLLMQIKPPSFCQA